MSEEYFEKMYQKYGGENVYTEKWLFIANNIFDFTTYDDEMSFKWYNEMIAVIRVILNRTTFEYQKEHYETYLFMCNLPFLYEKIEWGTSIRGAFVHGENEKYLRSLLSWASN